MFTRRVPILLSNTVNRRYEFTQIPYLDILTPLKSGTVTNLKEISGDDSVNSPVSKCGRPQEAPGLP